MQIPGIVPSVKIQSPKIALKIKKCYFLFFPHKIHQFDLTQTLVPLILSNGILVRFGPQVDPQKSLLWLPWGIQGPNLKFDCTYRLGPHMGPLDPHGVHPVYSIEPNLQLLFSPSMKMGVPPQPLLGSQQTQNCCQGPWGVPLGHLAGGKPNLNFRLKNRLAVISSSC